MNLEIKNPADRGTVAAILIQNGYACWLETIKKPNSSTKMIVLVAEKPGGVKP